MAKLISKILDILSYQGDESEVMICVSHSGSINIFDEENNRILTKYDVSYGAELKIKEGQNVTKGQILYEWDPYNSTIISEYGGRLSILKI